MKLFEKILIANRGEVALRILRACREMGIQTVAIHSTADAKSKHVLLADESVCIGPPASKDSYLNMLAIISAADITGSQAIHPGFGFLSENAIFARMVEEHGMTFIGPDPHHIDIMGDKITAKKTMKDLGVPVVPGIEQAITSNEEGLLFAHQIGFPVLIKATAGGGGKGMKVAHNPDEFITSLELAQGEAQASFGNPNVYIERYLKRPRHIEMQVIGDTHGNALHLFERDCSLQRRHQKIFEEAPSSCLRDDERQALGEVVVNAIAQMGYRGLGTLEFLYEDGQFFFMEMNTRIQVEHPVTEMITGIDLVKEQIRIAAGYPLSFSQQDIKINGHALECRINAEHWQTFIPSPGKITTYHPPGGYGVRVDSHLYDGYTVPPYYDSMVAKLITHGKTREEAISRMKRALHEYVIEGVETTIPLHHWLLNEDDIKKGDYHIHWLEHKLAHMK
jgi:acetyl-CoA carboxylase biotin carboxylase subunit